METDVDAIASRGIKLSAREQHAWAVENRIVR
jgi:hypothetical protein